MSYVDSNLMPGESIVARGEIHWVHYLDAVPFVFAAIVLLFVLPGVGVLFLFFGLIALLRAYILTVSTELAVTDRRVIAKFGFISRNTIELLHAKVETVNVDQSIIGRILDYGTLTITGTGGGMTPIPCIAAPLVFRREFLAALERR